MIQVEPLNLHEDLRALGQEMREELGPPTGRNPDQFITLHVAPELGPRVDVAQVLSECNDIVSVVAHPVQVLAQDIAGLDDLIELIQALYTQRLARVDPLGVHRCMPVRLDEAAYRSLAEVLQVLRDDIAEFREGVLERAGLVMDHWGIRETHLHCFVVLVLAPVIVVSRRVAFGGQYHRAVTVPGG